MLSFSIRRSIPWRESRDAPRMAQSMFIKTVQNREAVRGIQSRVDTEAAKIFYGQFLRSASVFEQEPANQRHVLKSQTVRKTLAPAGFGMVGKT